MRAGDTFIDNGTIPGAWADALAFVHFEVRNYTPHDAPYRLTQSALVGAAAFHGTAND